MSEFDDEPDCIGEVHEVAVARDIQTGRFSRCSRIKSFFWESGALDSTEVNGRGGFCESTWSGTTRNEDVNCVKM